MLSRLFKPLIVTLLQLTLLFALTAIDTHAADTQQIDKESLYKMLLADFASFRGLYNQALPLYVEQAKTLKSSSTAEDATRLALYLKQYDDMLDSALLWQKYSTDSRESLFYLAIAYSLNNYHNHAYQSMKLAYEKGHPSDFTRLASAIPTHFTAIDSYKATLKKAGASRENPDIYMALATLSEKQNDQKNTASYAIKSIEVSSYNPVFVELGIPLLEKHATQEILIDIYEKSIDAYPNNNLLRHKYALYLTKYSAIAAKEQLLILRKQLPADSDYIFHLALIHLELNELPPAKVLFEQLLALNEKTGSAHYYLGLISQHQNNPNEAIKHFLNINNPEEKQKISAQVAAAYIEGNHYEQALQITLKALNNPINDTQKNLLLTTQANIYQLLGNNKKSLVILDELSHENRLIDNELLYRKAMLYYNLDKPDKMERDLQLVIKRNPQHLAALNALGFTLADQSIRLEEAFKMIQTAHKLRPEDPAVLDSLGWVLYRLGRTDEAIKHLRSAIKQFPDAEVAAHLGEVLWVSGKKHDAKEVFSEALNREPEHRILNETIKRLAVPIQ